MTPGRAHGAAFWPALAAVGAVILCCVGPALLAVLAATGLGVVAARSAEPLAIGLGLAAAVVIAGLVWRRRRACACPGVRALSPDGAARSPSDGAAGPGPYPTRHPRLRTHRSRSAPLRRTPHSRRWTAPCTGSWSSAGGR